jgi:hypothetical protein
MNKIVTKVFFLAALISSSLAFGMAQKDIPRITNVEVAATNQTILIVSMNDPMQAGLIGAQPLREIPVGEAAFIDSIKKGKQALLNPVNFGERLTVISQDTHGNAVVTHLNRSELQSIAGNTDNLTLLINDKGQASLK